MAFEELKARHAVVWGAGPYQGVTETITDVHEVLIERLDPQPGERLLDLATGTGTVAERAAEAGAGVVGVDIAPALIEQAKVRADAQGLEIDYRVGDAEALELEDSSFDLVASSFGVMFAPDHEAIARELARVTKPGGRIALACWTPDSAMAQVFAVMRPFQPAPPDVWQLFSVDYGPTRVLADNLEDDRREQLHRSFVDLHEASRQDGGIVFSRAYLLTLGTRN